MRDEGWRRRFPALALVEPVAFLQALREQRVPEVAEVAAPEPTREERGERKLGRELERGRDR
jgi:hypothetical protein